MSNNIRTVFEEPLKVSENQLYALRSLKNEEYTKMVDNFRFGFMQHHLSTFSVFINN